MWTMGIQRPCPTRLVDNFVADSIGWRPACPVPEQGASQFRTCLRQELACRGKALKDLV